MTDDLDAAIAPFKSGSFWGSVKAWITHGAPTKAEGIAAAKQITEWQVALAAALASRPAAPGERVADGWRTMGSIGSFDRVFVAGWQKPSRSTSGYWWMHEDCTDEHGVPMDHPEALLWRPIPDRPKRSPEGLSSRCAPAALVNAEKERGDRG